MVGTQPVLGCNSTSPGISNADSSPSQFSVSLPAPSCMYLYISPPSNGPIANPSRWCLPHRLLGLPSSPTPHLTVVLPRFTLCHLVGELCLLVAHLSDAVEAVACLWKGSNTVASFPRMKHLGGALLLHNLLTCTGAGVS